MNVFKLEVVVIDFENIGADEIKSAIENARYPIRCISPAVRSIESRDIGEWSDDHPLNCNDTEDAELARMFGAT